MPFLPFLLLLAAPAAPQDAPLVRGAYHGPFDEALDESVVRDEDGRRSGSRETWERWEFWFEFEREALFRGPGRPDDLVLGKDGRYGSGPAALDRSAVLERAVPRLVAALGSPHAEVREAASLALGRIAAPGTPAALRAMLEDPSVPVRQAALLGLGLSGMGKALVPLAEVFSNRARSGGERAFAALGLGLSGRKEAEELLEQYLRANLKPDRLFGEEESVVLGAVWACGRLGESRLVPVLLEGYKDLERNAATASRRMRTVILAALGQMGDYSVRPFLVRGLQSSEVGIRRASAQALGLLGDRGAIGALARGVREESDIETVNFCLLAIGRLGGPGAETVLRDLEGPARRQRQTHAAWGLSAGLARAHGLLDELRKEFQVPGTRAFRGRDAAGRDFEKVRRDEERLRGALALGMGLVGDPNTVPLVLASVRRKGIDDDFAGYLAIALGLQGTDSAVAELRKEAAGPDARPEFRRGLVLGLALTGRPEAAGEIARILVEDADPTVRWEAGRALGLARTRKAFDTVLGALGEEGEVRPSPQQSAHLLLALGQLGGLRRGDGLAAILSGFDYRQEFPLFRALSKY